MPYTFCSWDHSEAVSGLISRGGCRKLKWACCNAGISLVTFSRFLWILDFRAALGNAGMDLCIPAHFPEFTFELCLVGVIRVWIKYILGLFFLPKHCVCSPPVFLCFMIYWSVNFSPAWIWRCSTNNQLSVMWWTHLAIPLPRPWICGQLCVEERI